MTEPFADPRLDAPTPLTVEDDVVFGHVAEWGRDHLSFPGRSIKPPKSPSGYRYLHLGAYQHDGRDVSVGCITLHTTHASSSLNADETRKHYEHTGAVAAYVRCGEDDHGIWFSGRVALGLEPKDLEALRGAKVSGDWRQIDGALELVGILAVSTPGFPIPRPRARIEAGSNQTLALVASGIVVEPHFAETRTRLRLANTRRRLRALK
jgi:hypothetical protein